MSKAPRAQPGRQRRRALSHVGGAVQFRGSAELESLVQRALAVRSNTEVTRQHVHGFHSYPARLHPQTAHELIAGLSLAGETVLDPFCGSGTVLVEARLLGRRALGADINPLSAELSKLKSRGAKLAERTEWQQAAGQIAEFASQRRLSRAGPLKRYSASERQLFEAHMLLELDSLAAGVAGIENKQVRAALRLVLSSIVTKVSRRSGDSSNRTGHKRLAGGYAIRLFVERTDELTERCAEFQARLETQANRAPNARVYQTDARELQPIDSRSVHLIVCSPPYPGVYDYYDHHRVRLNIMGSSSRHFERQEIGAKRQLSSLDPAQARARWQRDLSAVVRSCRRVLKPGGLMCCVLADVALSGAPLRGDEFLTELAEPEGLRFVAVGSQARPVFHRASEQAYRRRPRAEHLVVLRRPEVSS